MTKTRDAARCPVCQRELIVPQPKPLPDDEFAEFNEFVLPGPAARRSPAWSWGSARLSTCLLTGLPAIVLGMLGFE